MARRSKKSLLETAQDVVEHVSESAQDLAGQVADNVGPTIESVVDNAKDRADDVLEKAEETLHAGKPKRKKGKFKKFLLVSALVAIGGVVFSKFRDKKSQDANWQTSYTPTPAPTPSAPAPAAAPASDDAGGAGPSEALSDAAAEPHEASTPDEPSEVVEVDESAKG